MRHIIEQVLVNHYGKEQIASFLIEKDKILYTSNYFTKYSFMRLNSANFVIAPGHVMIDFTILSLEHYLDFKTHIKHLQQIGCTTLLTGCNIRSEQELLPALKKAKHLLINSSIDYVVGVKIPLKKLTAKIARICSTQKVPIIWAEIYDEKDLEAIAWQWIRNELFPYQLMIVPIWNISTSNRKLNSLKKKWDQILTENKIATDSSLRNEQIPLAKSLIQKIGIYPLKGSLQIGTSADYLLFSKKDYENANGNVSIISPKVVYANGIVKKAGSSIYFNPGIGKELVITVPQMMSPICNAFKRELISIDYYE